MAVTSWDARACLSLTKASHMLKSFSVLQDPLPCQARPSRLPDLSNSLQSWCVRHQNFQTCPARSEIAKELNHRALAPSFYFWSQHRNMCPGFQKNSTAWGLCWTFACKHNSGNCRMQLWKSGPGWEYSKNWPWAPLKRSFCMIIWEKETDRLIAQKEKVLAGIFAPVQSGFQISLNPPKIKVPG